jgi:hypothetical protein
MEVDAWDSVRQLSIVNEQASPRFLGRRMFTKLVTLPLFLRSLHLEQVEQLQFGSSSVRPCGLELSLVLKAEVSRWFGP